MKERILKILIVMTGLFAVSLFIIVHLDSPPAFILDVHRMGKDAKHECGDLYYMSNIKSFNTHLPELNSYDTLFNADILKGEADLFIFGDSFFHEARGMKPLPELLSDSLKLKVFFKYSSRPLTTLISNYKKGKRKILLLEIVERSIDGTFARPHSLLDYIKASNTSIRSKIIPSSKEFNYQSLLSNGKLISSIYTSVMTFKYNTFGLISDATPVYSRDPDWLFYFKDVSGKSGFYYNFTDEEIENYADNIIGLRNLLSESYNLELVLMLIPNKYTLYHKFANNDKYNNLIPRLNEAVEKRNVKLINVYDDFVKSDTVLYYPTDTHWNSNGIIVALNEILSKIKQWKIY